MTDAEAGGPPPPAVAPPPEAAMASNDHTAPTHQWDGFEGPFGDKNVRMAFIRKVYGLLSVMLSVSFAFILIFNLVEPIRDFAQRNLWIAIVALVVSLASLITLICCGEFRKKYPQNYICLAIFTLAQSTSLGILSAVYQTRIILLAVVITAVVCVAITIFAMQTKIDFTVYRGMLLAATIVLIVVGLIITVIGVFGIQIRILNVIYAGAGALIFAFWLLIDTQMIMGGKRDSVAPDEYVLAVLMLYLDIINLFLFILQLMQGGK